MGKKINDSGEFPAVTPADDDRVLGVDVSDTSNDPNGEVKTFTVSALRNDGAYATAAQGAKADTAVQPAAIADFETTTELNTRDTANRARANHTGTQAQSTITDLTTDLAAKAPLASPAFTGSPTAPTQAASDNSTKLATTAYVDAAAGGGGGGLVPISKTTASADAAVDISLTGGYTAYAVRIENVVPATDGAVLNLRVSTDGGSNFVSSATYSYSRMWLYTTFSQQDSSAATSVTLTGTIGNASGEGANGLVNIYLGGGTLWTAIESNIAHTHTGAFGGATRAGGAYKATTAVDAVRFLMSSGNITSGDFHLYGIADGA